MCDQVIFAVAFYLMLGVVMYLASWVGSHFMMIKSKIPVDKKIYLKLLCAVLFTVAVQLVKEHKYYIDLNDVKNINKDLVFSLTKYFSNTAVGFLEFLVGIFVYEEIKKRMVTRKGSSPDISHN